MEFGRVCVVVKLTLCHVFQRFFLSCTKTWATEILLPELSTCSVMVMDNASFHKRQDALEALQAERHTVLCPPYSPYFNPIEKTWAWIKQLRRQWRLADVNALLFWFFTLVTLY